MTTISKVKGAVLALGLLAWGCASQQSPAEEGLSAPMDPGHGGLPAPTGNDEVGRPEDRCTSIKSPGQVKRSAVDEVVDEGLGVWLQGVKVVSVRDKGRFMGWKIESLHLANPCYAAVDLRPGDVVLSVNGDNLENDTRAHEVWKALKTAPSIKVSFLRDGQPKTLQFDIVAD